MLILWCKREASTILPLIFNLVDMMCDVHDLEYDGVIFEAYFILMSLIIIP